MIIRARREPRGWWLIRGTTPDGHTARIVLGAGPDITAAVRNWRDYRNLTRIAEYAWGTATRSKED